MRIRRLIMLGLAVASLGCAAAEHLEKPSLRVGLNAHDAYRESSRLVLASLQAIRRALPEFEIKVRILQHDELIRATGTQGIDVLIAASDIYRRQATKGARDLATVASTRALNPNYAEGGLILVPSANLKLKTLEDLRGRNVLVSPAYGFAGREFVLGEIARISERPAGFFRVVSVENPSAENILASLRQGKADAAILPACLLEHYSEQTARDTSWLRVLNARQHSSLQCLHSTDLYPGLTMVTFPTVTPDTSRRILGALVETGEVDGNYWSIATDFSRLDRLLRTLELDDFSLFRRSFVSTMWARWRDVVLLALLVIIGLAAHSVRTRLVVRRQTSELRRLLDEQKRLHEQARVSSKRIEKLQRLGAMGQMSSLFAHELRQPLNSVICYAYSLLQRNDQIYADQTIHEGLSEIRSQAERADAIVRRVRSYVKSQSESLQNMILKDIIDKAIREFETSQPRHVPIRIQADPGIRVLADPLEMELVIINLLRNASEVQKDADDALIVVSLERTESSARLRIQDNGPQLTAQSVLRIQQSEDSTKPEGLGLGLSIVRMLVEKHNGTIRFAPGRRRGLVVTITLPLAPEIASGEES